MVAPPWTGVRNYQARNFMRDRMRVGDTVLFYHSNAEPSGVAGVGRVASAPYADPTQFDPRHEAHEPRATREKPVWMLVEVAFEEKFTRVWSVWRNCGRSRVWPACWCCSAARASPSSPYRPAMPRGSFGGDANDGGDWAGGLLPCPPPALRAGKEGNS
jgi:hypothetical protein